MGESRLGLAAAGRRFDQPQLPTLSPGPLSGLALQIRRLITGTCTEDLREKRLIDRSGGRCYHLSARDKADGAASLIGALSSSLPVGVEIIFRGRREGESGLGRAYPVGQRDES